MRRRDFICLFSAAALCPFAARTQPGPVIGFLGPSSASSFAMFVRAFHQGLKEGGFIEGKTVAVEYRWANDQLDRLPELAAELAGHPIQVLVTAGATAAALAAKGATSTIPVVFAIGADPVKFGLVASMNRPGGNITGVSFLSNLLIPKQIELLQQLVPAVNVVGVLVNPANPNAGYDVAEARAAASALRREVHIAEVHGEGEIDAAFEVLRTARAGAVLVLADPFFVRSRKRLADLAAHLKLPVMYTSRIYTEDGGLVSYGANVADAYRQVGIYVGRILKGDKPANLPVFQSTKLELVINLKAAKEIGLEVPTEILSRADEIIE
jgi:putative ABC transport system substrate-binding protein